MKWLPLATQRSLLEQDPRWRGIEKLTVDSITIYRASWYDESILDTGSGWNVDGLSEDEAIKKAVNNVISRSIRLTSRM